MHMNMDMNVIVMKWQVIGVHAVMLDQGGAAAHGGSLHLSYL